MNTFFENLKKYRLPAISIGLVYLWFGFLKFFPGLSPADALAKDTITNLTLGLIPSDISIILLAIWEVVIGVLFILNIRMKEVITLALVHMVLTFTPLFFFPDLAFQDAPFTLTLVGQYIMKNLVIISMLIIMYPTSRAGVSISGKPV